MEKPRRDRPRHLYLVRLRGDSDYDVLAFSDTLEIENVSAGVRVYHIEKEGECTNAAIESLTLEGERIPFDSHPPDISFAIAVPPGQHRKIVISYKNALGSASVGTARTSMRIYFLRMASDIRDIWLPKSRIGSVVTTMYYKRDDQGHVMFLLKVVPVFLVAVAVTVGGVFVVVVS